ncbi:MAG: GSCFA domain-containing protein [Rhodospirillaceae bacterium]
MDAPAPPNLKLWSDFTRQPSLIANRRKLLNANTKIFTMGSCFALEIRRAMARRGFDVFPHYTDVVFDPTQQIFDMIPKRESVAHYDTFVIRQEFEAALGVWTDREAGFWEVRDVPGLGKVAYQEPTRKLIYAKSLAALKDLDDKIDAVVRQGLIESDLIVITLGLTEVWRHDKTGRYLCRPPGTGYGGGDGLATFRQSTFVENYQNVRATLDLLFSKFPDKHVVLTVSPVPLAMTYSDEDVGTANLESKSILRAVAGQICREYGEQTTYFPSYEMATILPFPVFQEDKRHVLPEFADRVVTAFHNMFS